ncbi:MAG: hypothetical protein R3E01_30810 [Pirellulaceae bacterium]
MSCQAAKQHVAKHRVAGRQRRGMLILVVLVIVLMLGVVATGFLLDMQTENLAARAANDELAARQAALSARELLAAQIEMPRQARDEVGGWQGNSATLRDQILFAPEDSLNGAASSSGTESFSNGQLDNTTCRLAIGPWTSARPNVDIHTDEVVTSAIECESGKLNLLALLKWEESQPGLARSCLQAIPGMTDDVMDQLLSAPAHPMGPSTTATTGSATTGPTTRASLSLWGTNGDTSATQIDETAAISGSWTDQGTQVAQHRWQDFLTVYSAERNEAYDGRPRVFVNSDNVSELYMQLRDRVSPEWAQFIVLYRQYGPGGSSGSVSGAGALEPDLSIPLAHPISSIVELIGATVAVPQGADTVTVASPIDETNLAGEVGLVRVADQLTTTPDRTIVGRVNVNKAPREVLLAIPGTDETIVDRIMSSRESSIDGPGNRIHETWLLAEGLVDRQQMQDLLPYITVGGDVFRAQVWGYFLDGSAVTGLEVVLDGSAGRTKQVFLRELYTADVRAALAVNYHQTMSAVGMSESPGAAHDSRVAKDRFSEPLGRDVRRSASAIGE